MHCGGGGEDWGGGGGGGEGVGGSKVRGWERGRVKRGEDVRERRGAGGKGKGEVRGGGGWGKERCGGRGERNTRECSKYMRGCEG